jgi:hypothetical protein
MPTESVWFQPERHGERGEPIVESVLDRLFQGRAKLKSVMGEFERADVKVTVSAQRDTQSHGYLLVELENPKGDNFTLELEYTRPLGEGTLVGADGQQIGLTSDEVRTLNRIADSQRPH